MILGAIFAGPMMVAQRGARWYWFGRVAMALAGICAFAVWLGAPFAIWSAAGMGWTLLWLVPTTVALFALTSMPQGGG